ncbi:hypothetical protein BUALT_Bualt17G0002200 [Buddleja alternifolia]|uniref:U5 small nuclear ribonucleoprotein TSSC4 n=1 Tax=Buddleja alternifolia TaxID=168488 RepID=A0AAV6W5B7_9LAMI|nr:hypothetical protein BUALT_Bualt17G0002200 [Buddleja alternifolia]
MEDNFRVRVDKIFGSLGNETASSLSNSTPSSSLWCLTDQEKERRKWNRNKEEEEEDDEAGVVSDLGLGDVQEEEEEEDEDEIEEIGEDGGGGVDNKRMVVVDEDDWDVESNIGRDCTLDFEEEEDKYDKVAAGMEQTGDRLYMKDVKFDDYGTHELNTYGELPSSYQAVVRDPRANHEAAKIRLKEDAEAAGNFDTLHIFDTSVAAKNVESEHYKTGDVNVDNPKPILKKRENSVESRSQKRVRFMFEGTQNCEEQQRNDLASETCSRNDDAVQQQDRNSYGVPDYVKNPSKYTHYTFDSSADMDEQSNQKAFTDLFHYLRERNTVDSSFSCDDIPKSVVFTPKRKPEDESIPKFSESNVEKKGCWSIGVTAEDAMEEDEPPCLPPNKSQKSGRQYRTRTNANIDDNLDLDVN